MIPPTTTLAQISEETGEPIDRLREWQQLGLLPGDPDALPISHTERVRLIQFAATRGISPEELADSSKSQGDLLGVFVESLGRLEVGPTFSLDEAASKSSGWIADSSSGYAPRPALETSSA